MNQREIMQALLDGKKVRRKCWEQDSYVHFVDDRVFENKTGLTYGDFSNVRAWELYEEPKKAVFMAPAIFKADDGYIEVSGKLFVSEEGAKYFYGKRLISWPALPNKEGFYEVPEK